MTAAPAWIDRIRWNDQGLVACIAQHVTTAEVLMLAWMNEASLRRTLETGTLWYWSRSRQALWHKGETSGTVQHLRALHLDCDGDALLALVAPEADGACHTGAPTCWDPPGRFDAADPTPPRHVLAALWRTIEARDRERPAGSWTTRLLEGGVDRIGKKVGEEATEVVIAAKNAQTGQGTAELAAESADLLFHLMVLWRSAGMDPAEVFEVLARRRSG